MNLVTTRSKPVKTCITCDVVKQEADFHRRSDTGRIKNRCRSCESEWHRKHYSTNRDVILQSRASDFATAEAKEKRRAYRESRKDQDRVWKKNWDLQRNYGIDSWAFDATLEAQHCCCPICSRHFPNSSKMWHVDHCHSTGRVRGIICANCNTMLGQAKDNPKTLCAAADYLEKNK